MPGARGIWAALAAVVIMGGGNFAASACEGAFVRVSDGEELTFSRMVEGIPSKAHVLLGERHGVAAHPKAAGCLIEALAGRGGVALVLEHLRQDQQGVVDAYRASHPEVVAGLGTRLAWWESGWPVFKIYLPLFEAAWRQRVPVVGGDLPRIEGNSRTKGDASRSDSGKHRNAHPVSPSSAITPPTVLSTEALPETLVTAWGKAMGEAHCGLVDDKRKAELGALQVRRDQAMAAAIRGRPEGFTLLYAGRSHVRHDRGVPKHLGDGRALISIALQEMRDVSGAIDRPAVIAAARGVFDFIWFTGETDEKPICDALRQKGLVP